VASVRSGYNTVNVRSCGKSKVRLHYSELRSCGKSKVRLHYSECEELW